MLNIQVLIDDVRCFETAVTTSPGGSATRVTPAASGLTT
jgi:hypothetical protein